MAKTLHHQVITGALALIADEFHWSRGAWARTATGQPCAWADPSAVKFCAMGALNRAALELAHDVGNLAISAGRHVLAANGVSNQCFPQINDLEGHARIVAMFKRALT